jgi:hypothetical protein
MASRHLDHFSKHKEINFDNFITVSLSVDFIISTGKLCSFISPSNLRSFLKDYYRLHRELGIYEVMSRFNFSGWQTLHTRSSCGINKRWTFISPPGTQYFTKCLPVIILYYIKHNILNAS